MLQFSLSLALFPISGSRLQTVTCTQLTHLITSVPAIYDSLCMQW